jgi:glycosyltransferase involved in cell wall biosynthesis
MRVLWFVNNRLLPVTRKLGIPGMVTGGWMEGLRLALQGHPGLELGIASASEISYESFEEGGVVYFNIPCPAQNGKLATVLSRWAHRTELPGNLNNCLDIVNKFKPDIIHVHGSEKLYGLLAGETSIPVVISIQGILTVYEKLYFGGFNLMDGFSDFFSKKFLSGNGFIHKYLTMRKSATCERRIMKSCKYFIGRTEFDKNFVSMSSVKSRYYHCDEILRPSFYSIDRVLKSSDRPIIYCISSSLPYKGLDCLLMACNILKSTGFVNIQLRVSGKIQNSDIWNAIKRRVDELQIADDVVWLGQSSEETIMSELKNASVFVLPSYAENSPNSLAEAMSAGVPCVASYVGGVPSMVCHGEDALLFPAGDPYSLAGMISKVLKDSSLAKTLSDHAIMTAQKRHDPKKIAATIMSIYSEIINNSSEEKQ